MPTANRDDYSKPMKKAPMFANRCAEDGELFADGQTPDGHGGVPAKVKFCRTLFDLPPSVRQNRDRHSAR